MTQAAVMWTALATKNICYENTRDRDEMFAALKPAIAMALLQVSDDTLWIYHGTQDSSQRISQQRKGSQVFHEYLRERWAQI